MNRFLSINLILLMFFVLAAFLNVSAQTSFSVGKAFVQDGDLIAPDKIDVRVGEEFSGKGYIEAPVIEIATKRFTFTGTIHCDDKCILRVEEPFDEAMFKREGSGIFEIIIEPLAPQKQEDTFFGARDRWAEVEQRQKERDDELERILAESEARRAELDRQGEERRQYWANFHKAQEKAQQEREARRSDLDSQREETIQQREEEPVSLEKAQEKVEEQQKITEPEESELELELFDYYRLGSYAYIAALVISAIVYSY